MWKPTHLLCYHWGRHVHRFTVRLTLPSKNRGCHFHLLRSRVLQERIPTIDTVIFPLIQTIQWNKGRDICPMIEMWQIPYRIDKKPARWTTEMIHWNQTQIFRASLFQQWSMTDQSSQRMAQLLKEPHIIVISQQTPVPHTRFLNHGWKWKQIRTTTSTSLIS